MLGRKKRRLLDELKARARLLAGCNDEKAAPLFEQLCALEPEQPRWPHKVGECYDALGDLPRALAAYRTAVALYTEQGFALQAIALGRRLFTLDPTHGQSQSLVAEAYASREPSVVAPLPRAPGGIDDDAIPSLAAIELHRLPTARRRAASPGEGAAYDIPLDDEVEDAQPPAEVLVKQLPPTPLFSALDPPALRQLIEQVTVQQRTRGEEVYRQGDAGDSLFVVVEGLVGVYRDDVESGRLGDGAFFGELALLTEHERWATVRVASDHCTLIEISRQVLHNLMEGHPGVLTALLRFFRDQLIDRLVATSPLFTPFSGPDRQELIKRFRFLEAEARCPLVTAGRGADGLYVLLCGDAEVLWPDGAVSEPLHTGDLFDVTSLLNNQPALYTVRTSSKCWLLKLEREAFREVIMTHPQVLAMLSELATEHQQQGKGSGPLRKCVTMV